MMIGYLKIKHMRTGKEQYISYFDILTNTSQRILLLRKLQSDPDLKMFCCCSDHDDKEVFISPDGIFQFPKGIPHSSICVEYLNNMLRLTSGTLAPFITKGFVVPVSFSWNPKSRRKLTFMGDHHSMPDLCSQTYDMEMLTETLNSLAFQKTMQRCHGKGLTPDEFLDALQASLLFDIGQLKLKDPKDEELTLSGKRLLTPKSPANDIYFLYGKVLSVDERFTKYVYLRVRTINAAEITITIDQTVWDNKMFPITKCPHVSDAYLWISGIIETKILKSYKKGSYDPMTGTTTNGEMNTYKANKLRQGTLFFANDYGLLCTSMKELKEGNAALSSGEYLERTFLPLPFKAPDGAYTWNLPYAVCQNSDHTFRIIW